MCFSRASGRPEVRYLDAVRSTTIPKRMSNPVLPRTRGRGTGASNTKTDIRLSKKNEASKKGAGCSRARVYGDPRARQNLIFHFLGPGSFVLGRFAALVGDDAFRRRLAHDFAGDTAGGLPGVEFAALFLWAHGARGKLTALRPEKREGGAM